MTFPDSKGVDDTELIAARLGDGDAASDSDASGDFQPRNKNKRSRAQKVVLSESDSDGSGMFEVRTRKRSKKKARDDEVVIETADVHDSREKDDGKESPQHFSSPDERVLLALDGAEFEKIDIPDDLAHAIGYDPNEFVPYVQVE